MLLHNTLQKYIEIGMPVAPDAIAGELVRPTENTRLDLRYPEQCMTRKGFTLIELLIVVVIIGILAAIAIPKFANTKSKSILASMKTDLRNLATAQEAYYFDFSVYAPAIGPVQGPGVVAFTQTIGNVMAPIANANNLGYTATMTNPALTVAPMTCGIFVGPIANSPNAVVTQEAAPGCW